MKHAGFDHSVRSLVLLTPKEVDVLYVALSTYTPSKKDVASWPEEDRQSLYAFVQNEARHEAEVIDRRRKLAFVEDLRAFANAIEFSFDEDSMCTIRNALECAGETQMLAFFEREWARMCIEETRINPAQYAMRVEYEEDVPSSEVLLEAAARDD